MTAIANAENLWQYKRRFYSIAEQILAFVWSPNVARELTNLYYNFKQTEWQYFTLSNIIIWLVRSILTLNSKQFHQKIAWYSHSLYIVDITCHYL